MKSHGNIWAKETYGTDRPPNGVTKDDTAAWKQYLMDKYVHMKYAPKKATTTTINGNHKSLVTPLSPHKSSPGKSQRSSSSKFTNQAMPDTDLIHFDSTPTVSPITARQTKLSSPTGVAGPRQSTDFFADFGL
jgi:hypothetical protein